MTKGERLKQAREIKGFTVLEVANKLRALNKQFLTTKSTISKLENDIIKSSKYDMYFAMLYGVTPEWLKFGDEKTSIMITRGNSTKEIAELPRSPILSCHIPILSWQQITGFGKTKRNILQSLKKLNQNNHKNWVYLPPKGSHDSFAIVMDGNSMASEHVGVRSFFNCDQLYFDPTLELKENCYVLAKINKSKQVVFRQYVKDCDSYCLKPLNSQFPVIPFTKHIIIIGVLFYQSCDFT